jgi:hypothetical protein
VKAFCFRDTHAELAAGDALDARAFGPCACFQLQLAVFDLELPRTFLFTLKFAKALSSLVL